MRSVMAALVALIPFGSALAEDAIFNGAYVGAAAGYSKGNSSQRSVPTCVDVVPSLPGCQTFADGDYTVVGGTVGGTLGYNWRRQGIVVGVEADFSWAGISGSTTCGLGSKCGTDMESFGTVRGRLGLLSGDNLFYLTGGWAFAHVTAFDHFDPQEGSKLRSGWTVGAGFERKLHERMSLKVEYLYADFGKSEHFQTTGFTPESIGLDVHVVRVGLNFALVGRDLADDGGLK